MPARCGVQKKSRKFALSGGGQARLRPMAGKRAGLPAGGRAGKFARFVLAEMEMCKCADAQTGKHRGSMGEAAIYTYTCAHARAHVLHFEAKLCAFCTNNAFLSDNQRI